ncbi:type I polyketide synthase [Roseibium sp. RKSG952]|uniref:type I polyketide synthase n=1 Tax=Roseibium sp. RKSG952 TaxID=2529384 RepID=UPI001AD90E4D
MASLTSNIDIIGYSNRLPGANTPDEFWDLLKTGTCSVTSVSEARWPLARFGHPDQSAAGKSYTWAAGQLDDVWAFDPAFFGISPREALQMDPQQRLLLQLVWEALEQANVRPSDLAGTNTGVYVGASSLDYHHRFLVDPATADMQFMTGNTLSIVSNRISYIYDLRGPSFTVDTACSSSLVALHEAVSALESGQIDTAIVCGVSLLLSPFAFVGFSRATMLSPTGLCQAFDANGDGYVRSEGGVVMVLRARRAGALPGTTAHARILASGINADGRTVGMSLPSPYAQAGLLREMYDGHSIDPNALAFVEAHGTGTRVGDPAEADALGKVIGQKRGDVLPIGSVKTNVGHLEPVSGLVGLLKATLALKNDLLPPSLHFNNPNPDIPFEELNLKVAGEAVELPARTEDRLAGVNSFGFGGTNAHTIISDGDRVQEAHAEEERLDAPLILSARASDALKALAATYRDMIADGSDAAAAHLATSTVHGRDLAAERLIVLGDTAEKRLAALDAFLKEEPQMDAVSGSAFKPVDKIGYAFAGNGSQWAGMGQEAYQKDEAFRLAFERVDKIFMGVGGWSLLTTLFAEDLESDLERAEVAQPLLFAIQVALVDALRDRGVEPDAVTGHSVGEVAAAWCCGALSLEQAVKVIHARSSEQEVVRDLGSMAALLLPADQAVDAIKKSGLPRLELAAVNSPRSVTISGDAESLDAFAKFARKNKWALRRLNLAYPFHSALVDPIKAPLLNALDGLKPTAPEIPFYSTVDPEADAVELSANYWWQNVRKPVRFADAVSRMTEDGIGVFVEIGPKVVLATYINDVVRHDGKKAQVLASLDQPGKKTLPTDNPVTRIAALIVANGGRVDLNKYVAPRPERLADLPTYPWQNTEFKPEPTGERIDFMFGTTWPLLGYRLRQDAAEWFNHVNTGVIGWLEDHKVEGSVVFPAAGFLEMALRAGLRWTKSDAIELRDFDILRPLVMEGDEIWETLVRISPDDRVVEVLSRPRLSEGDWSLNARGHFSTPSTDSRTPRLSGSDASADVMEHDALYALTETFGLNYGPVFRRAESVVRHDERTATVSLRPQADAVINEKLALCPTLVDSGFHGLFALLRGVADIPDQTSFLPIRVGGLRLLKPEGIPASVRIKVTKASPRSIEATFEYLDEGGQVVARLMQARFRAVKLGRESRADELAYRQIAKLLPEIGHVSPIKEIIPEGFGRFAANLSVTADAAPDPSDQSLLIEALGRTVAHSTLWNLSTDGIVSVSRLLTAGKLHETSVPLAANLLSWLEEDGIAEALDGEDFALSDPASGPEAASIMQTVLQEGAAHISEAALLARLNTDLATVLEHGLKVSASEFYANGLFDAYTNASPAALARSKALQDLALGVVSRWPDDKALRILIVGAGSTDLSVAVDQAIAVEHTSIVVTDPSEPVVSRAERLWAGSQATQFAELNPEALSDAGGEFDAIIVSESLAAVTEDHWNAIKSASAPGALVVAAEALPSPVTDLIRGVGKDWWQESVSAEFPISIVGSKTTEERFLASGVEGIETAPINSDMSEMDLVSGYLAPPSKKREESSNANSDVEKKRILLFTDAEGDARKLADGLIACLEHKGFAPVMAVKGGQTGQLDDVWTLNPDNDLSEIKNLLAAADGNIVHVQGAYVNGRDDQETVDQRTWSLTRILNAIGPDKANVTVIAPGGGHGLSNGQTRAPAQAAIWAYGRVAMNEFPDANLKLIDVSPTLEPGIAAARLADEISHDNCEREIILEGRTRYGLRILQGGVLTENRLPQAAKPAMRLDIMRQGALDQLAWQPVSRAEPAGSEVEIAVEASGLNFRDVMWALGLLPEEALEDGFAGPTLGMECCGTIVSCGEGVTRFKPGDRVITFAPACFASHVTVDESGCAPMPSAVSSEEAATIPVTFLTAYYALVHLAHLSEGETVLIHGGAGGVGLAALQIAKARGARIIATAGSPEKRNTLRLLGADVVLDSRSLAFVDAVFDETDGEGVDVVLNSLFGEAMERSIEVLKPFGRFLELGKRDYYGNTRIGLRPFRQNLTYFGIDADQLLTRQPKLAEELFTKLVALFEDGTLTPLPYRIFEADQVVDAFRLMQQAGHIGKIVLRPPQVPGDIATQTDVTFDPDGVYVIAGGFGGFGAELQRRLVDRGARHIAVLSRRGSETEEAAALIDELRQRAATVTGYACDITDEDKIVDALAQIRAKGQLIKGVFHTAMVLNDVLISNLDHDGLTRVLAPKVKGAELLDRHTAADPLDHFVLYSSATTLVGNPGQANYVAANGYLEALARKRRTEGKPGLAVAWGAIADAGYLARNEDVNELLSRKLGRHALTAKEALDGLMHLMSLPQDNQHMAAVGYARIDWQAARKDLALMGSPLVGLLGLGSEEDAGVEGAIDLHALLAGLDKVAATQTVAKLLAAEIGKILRIAPEEIDHHKPLSDIGMDSLMALELRMSAERQLGIDIPLMSLANGATLIDLSGRVAGRVLGEEAEGISAESQQLASQHVTGDLAEQSDLSDVAAKVEDKSRELGSFL